MSSVLKGLYIGTVIGAATTELVRKITSDENYDKQKKEIILKDRESLQIIMFYNNLCPTYENNLHFLNEIHTWKSSSNNWKKFHGYIQWIFPIPFYVGQEDGDIPSPPLLTKKVALFLQKSLHFQSNYKISIIKFLEFSGFKFNPNSNSIEDYFLFEEYIIKQWNTPKYAKCFIFNSLTVLIISLRCLTNSHEKHISEALAYTLFKLVDMGLIKIKHKNLNNLKAAILKLNLWDDDNFLSTIEQYSNITNKAVISLCKKRFAYHDNLSLSDLDSEDILFENVKPRMRGINLRQDNLLDIEDTSKSISDHLLVVDNKKGDPSKEGDINSKLIDHKSSLQSHPKINSLWKLFGYN